MPFKIVKTIEDNEPVLSIVPHRWESNGFLHRPVKNADVLLLRRLEKSAPDKNWTKLECVVERTNLLTFQKAETELAQMSKDLKETDTDNSVLMNILLGKMDQVIDSNKNQLDNITEAINNLQETQKVLYDNQQTIILYLSKIDAHFSQMSKKMTKSSFAQNSYSDFKPLKTCEDVAKLEESLKDPEVEEDLRRKLSLICAKGKRRGTNNAYMLIDTIFDRKLLLKYSWSGGSRGQDTKVIFKTHNRIMKFFFSLVHAADDTYTLEECYDFFKMILRNSRKRSESKQLRLSSAKNRCKRIYIDSNHPDPLTLLPDSPSATNEEEEESESNTSIKL